MLLKIVIPASFCFWFIGFVMGHILDESHDNPVKKREYKLTNDNEAYTMPSMFSSDGGEEQVDIDGEPGEL